MVCTIYIISGYESVYSLKEKYSLASMENLEAFYYRYLRYFLAKDDATATPYDKYMALSYGVRSQMVDKWIETQKNYHQKNVRRVYYLSMEYVLGKSLRQNVISLNLEESVMQLSQNLGFSLDQIYDQEDDFELGNGGKGRLAACYQEAMASLGVPAMAYGIRYDYALFHQKVQHGIQVERPYDWLHKGHPWEIVRPEYACTIGFHGRVEPNPGQTISSRSSWRPSDKAIAVPYDMPIPGYKNETVNTLRLWSARPSEEFLPDYLNHGDYVRACEEKSQSGRLTKILFPDEDVRRATELRIKQQYFFVAASLSDIVRRFKLHNNDIRDFSKKVVIQLNGSRCALAVSELMRLLVDDEGVSFEEAWSMTREVFAYTSHAVSRENLENWPIYLMEQIVPRNVQLIYEINQRHLDGVRRKGVNDNDIIRELSVIEEGEVKRVKMAHLAVLGSFSVNGVSREQSEKLSGKVFGSLGTFTNTRFHNITNGIAHRRWLQCINRPLANLITEAVGDGWTYDSGQLSKLEAFAQDEEFLIRLDDVKHTAKRHLSDVLKRELDVEIDDRSLMDIQAKKIHPYKRQVLQVLCILSRYLRICSGEEQFGSARTHIFAGKASPSDHLAKQIIHLISLAIHIVNNDSRVSNKMKVIFVPDYGVTWAEHLVPAADLSEQIATPGLEASGTSNMKFALNGSLSILSRSGSNIEMAEQIGEENLILFGNWDNNKPARPEGYSPSAVLNQNPHLSEVFSLIENSLSQIPEGSAIYPLLSSLRDTDEFQVIMDFEDYCGKQDQIDALYTDRRKWLRMCLYNIARSATFSSDRSIREYRDLIWDVPCA